MCQGCQTSQSFPRISAQSLLRYFDKDNNTCTQTPVDVSVLILHYNKYCVMQEGV